MAYLDTVGTRAEDRVYKRMRLVLESAHRTPAQPDAPAGALPRTRADAVG